MRLDVGKQYNLNNIKDIKVTEDFLGLSERIRKCQIDETYDECKTRNLIVALMQSCKCLPFSMGDSDKVILFEKNIEGHQCHAQKLISLKLFE